MSDVDILGRLLRKIHGNIKRWDLYNAYYEGARRLQALGLSLPPGMEDLQVVINWSGMWIDALEERLDVEGFRLGDATDTDDELWDWWQANNLDEESGLAHTEALFSRQAYAVVGFPDEDGDPPVITAESSRYMAHEDDPRTRRVQAAARLYDDDEIGRPQRAALYLPDRNVYYVRGGSRGWVVEDARQHNLGMTPVVPLTNRARLGAREGATEMRDIMELSDAACRSITNLQGAQEVLAVPSRYVMGASEDDFVDSKTGETVPTWQAYLGRMNALQNDQARVFQLEGADLRNFTETVNFYARTVSGLTGLPAHYLGFTSDNPASADAIRSGETRLVKKAERKQRAFGGDWERVMRLAMRVAGRDPDQARRLETVWRNPATPTHAAMADSVTKLFQAGILPLEAAWEQMGYSSEYRRRLRSLSSSDPAARYLETIERMRQGQGQGGQAGGGPAGQPSEGAAA